jgi:glycerol kinase
VAAVAVGAEADQLRVDGGAARQRMFALFQDQAAGALADHQAVAPLSNGRGVVCGASLRVLVANSVSNTAASVAHNSSAPPAIIAVCLPPLDRLVGIADALAARGAGDWRW